MPPAQGLVDLLEIFHARTLLRQVDGQIHRLQDHGRDPMFHDPARVQRTLAHYQELRYGVLQLLSRLGDHSCGQSVREPR